MDNISKVKSFYESFAKGDIAPILASVAGDCVWSMEAPPQLAWGGIRRGPAEVAGFFGGIAASGTNHNLEMTRFIASGDEVAAFGRYQVDMHPTGKRVDSPVAHYFRFRDGKVVEYINIVNTAAFIEAMTP